MCIQICEAKFQSTEFICSFISEFIRFHNGSTQELIYDMTVNKRNYLIMDFIISRNDEYVESVAMLIFIGYLYRINFKT